MFLFDEPRHDPGLHKIRHLDLQSPFELGGQAAAVYDAGAHALTPTPRSGAFDDDLLRGGRRGEELARAG